jgi:hypothetical protein
MRRQEGVQRGIEEDIRREREARYRAEVLRALRERLAMEAEDQRYLGEHFYR